MKEREKRRKSSRQAGGFTTNTEYERETTIPTDLARNVLKKASESNIPSLEKHDHYFTQWTCSPANLGLVSMVLELWGAFRPG